MTPVISFVIATRNDNWCGDSLGRLRQTMRSIGTAFSNRPGIEIVLVDWGSADPLLSHITVDDHSPCSLLSAHVPQELTRAYEVEFCETVALNLGIRMATAPLVCRLDQDTMIGWQAAQILYSQARRKLTYSLFSGRRDMSEGTVGIDPTAPINSADLLGKPDFFRGAIGVLATIRETWDQLAGYDESMIHRLHIEHEICERMRNAGGLRDIGPETNWGFYHQWHDRAPGLARKENPAPPQDEIRRRLAGRFRVNGENWGMKEQWHRLNVTRRDGQKIADSTAMAA
jgi:hypothetical protein